MSVTVQEAIHKISLHLYRSTDLYNRALSKEYREAAAEFKQMMDAEQMAIDALREKAEREDPLPLTEEEVRQMVGEPVWTVGVSSNGGTWAGWDIIESVDDDGCFFGYSTEKPEWWAYGLRNPDGALCGCAWIAYRHKPKEG